MSQERAKDEPETTGPEGGGDQAGDAQREFDDPLDRMEREAGEAAFNVQESDQVEPSNRRGTRPQAADPRAGGRSRSSGFGPRAPRSSARLRRCEHAGYRGEPMTRERA